MKIKPKIVSATYSIKLSEKIIKKCQRNNKYKGSLAMKLLLMESIDNVRFPLNDYRFDTIEITIKTTSIKQSSLTYNNQLWQTIACIINEHLKKEG